MASDLDGPQFGRDDVDIVKRDSLYQGFFHLQRLDYRHRRYRGDWSPLVRREVLYRGEAVGVLLHDPAADMLGLVEQVRPGAIDSQLSPWCLEIVAGIVEPGESLQEVAHREMLEEAGSRALLMQYICEFFPSPGGSDERIHLFYAQTDLGEVHGSHHGLDEEGEDIQLLVLPVDEVLNNLYGGRFNNANTLITLQWLQLNRSRLRDEWLRAQAD